MGVYIFRAALYCEECGDQIKRDLGWKNNYCGDSDYYPVYVEDSGEADSPQHCDSCHVPLENPLTSEGVNYVLQTIADKLSEILVNNDDCSMIWNENNIFTLFCIAHGAKIDYENDALLTDVKAVTMYKFLIEKREKDWYCHVILDL